MRSSLLILLAASPLVVACGGDDDGGKMITLPDAKVFMDAAIDAPPACALDSSYGTIATGSSQNRQMGDWFDTYPTGHPLAGRTYFYTLGRLGTATQPPVDILVVEVVKPANGNFTLNTAINFEASTTASSFNAVAYILGDVTQNAAMEIEIAQYYWASSGSVTLTNIGETDGNMITGSVTAANFREINTMTGADVAGGCTTSIAGMTFALVQMDDGMAAPGDTNESIDPAIMKNAFNVIQNFKRQQGIQ